MAVSVCAVLAVAGCGRSELVSCSGRVTFDGQPIATGSIAFRPLEPGVPPQGGRIVDGGFTLRCRPGRHRVEILASRVKSGAEELTPGMKPMEQYIPARYNDESKLTVDVGPAGENQLAFELSSKE